MALKPIAEDLVAALRFYSRLPLPEWGAAPHAAPDMNRLAYAVPLAGLVLGVFRRMVNVAHSRNEEGPVLTSREVEVLRRVAKGMAYREIADELFVSHRTVQNHVQNVLRKLQLHNRVELTLYAIDQGLHDPNA